MNAVVITVAIAWCCYFFISTFNFLSRSSVEREVDGDGNGVELLTHCLNLVQITFAHPLQYEAVLK